MKHEAQKTIIIEPKDTRQPISWRLVRSIFGIAASVAALVFVIICKGV